MTDRLTPRYPGNTVHDWRTKRGKLTRKAARYLNPRTGQHYRYIAKLYGGREANGSHP